MLEKRIDFFDSARAICMLYIVGFWHMQEYTQYEFFLPITYALMRGVLSTFVFISAYLQGRKKVESFHDAWNLVKKRLLRIYPLFFVACTTLYFIHIFLGKDYILDSGQYIRTLLGLSFIITPAPSTVWFINMIFLFDIIALFVNAINKFKWKLMTCIGIIGGVFWQKILFDGIDDRILIYCPIYCVGLLVPAIERLSERINYYILFGGIIVFCGLYRSSETSVFMNILTSMVCIGVILQIGKVCSKCFLLKKIMSYISYGSMCAYLFHRQILYVVYSWIGPFPMWFAVLIMLPIVVIVSYYIQKLYDKLCKHMLIRKN